MFPDWLGNVASVDVGFLIFALYRVVETLIYGPEQECEADRNALELCLKAGYDGQKCVELFNKLEKLALDMGDVTGTFGPDDLDEELFDEATWSTKIRIWLHQRKRGYLPIRERRERLLRHLDNLTGCTALPRF